MKSDFMNDGLSNSDVHVLVNFSKDEETKSY